MVTTRTRIKGNSDKLTVTVHPLIMEQLKEAAWKQRKTLSGLVNDVLAEWVAAQEESDNTAVLQVSQ
jgi:predicted HicB family RNase H-like nuclease